MKYPIGLSMFVCENNKKDKPKNNSIASRKPKLISMLKKYSKGCKKSCSIIKTINKYKIKFLRGQSKKGVITI